jgi:AcrR family transcriptional regulator
VAKRPLKSSAPAIQTRQLWIDAGLKVLAEKGPDGLRIDTLSIKLSLTKGSFYHHFADRQAYLEALLDEWKTMSTERLIAMSNQAATPEARFNLISRMVEHIDHRLETALRLWAAFDPAIQAAVTRVDRRRIAYICNIAQSITSDRETAKFVAELGYSSFIGAQVSGKVRLNPNWYARLAQMLELGAPPDPAKSAPKVRKYRQ